MDSGKTLKKSILSSSDTRLASNTPPGQDLRFTYISKTDETEQPYAVYVPSNYTAVKEWPLVINLHGTSAGFDEKHVGETSTGYGSDRNALFLWAAENHGAILATPHGRGITEFRGLGENDVFCVLNEVKRLFNIDENRISLTGLSMGGTASFEIGLHHPDVFASVAPIASAYSFPWLATNGQHTPFWCIGGQFDRDFVQNGGLTCAERMIQLGYPTKLDVLKTREHSDFVPEFFDQVMEWLLKHEVIKFPKQYTFTTDFPMFGQAYWSAIDVLEKPEHVGAITAHSIDPSNANIATDNLVGFTIFPRPEIFDLDTDVNIIVDGHKTFTGNLSAEDELRFRFSNGGWDTTILSRRETKLTDFRIHPIANSPRKLTMEGIEAPLANWVTDAMRTATGADLAIFNRRYHRGAPIPQGKVDAADLLQCGGASSQYLVVAEISGTDIVDILEDNIDVPYHVGHSYPMTVDLGENEFLVQVSGFSYTFNRKLPTGNRIAEHDLDLDRIYTVAMEGQVPERAEIWRRATLRLSDKYPLKYEITKIPSRNALFAKAISDGIIDPTLEGRVREA